MITKAKGGVSGEVKDNSIEIKPVTDNIAAKWERIAEQEKADMKKMVYSDKSYEEVFRRK